jgi:hypothetical protein
LPVTDRRMSILEQATCKAMQPKFKTVHRENIINKLWPILPSRDKSSKTMLTKISQLRLKPFLICWVKHTKLWEEKDIAPTLKMFECG